MAKQPLTQSEIEAIERNEKVYNPENIRSYNNLLIARMRLKQIDEWRNEQLRRTQQRLGGMQK